MRGIFSIALLLLGLGPTAADPAVPDRYSL